MTTMDFPDDWETEAAQITNDWCAELDVLNTNLPIRNAINNDFSQKPAALSRWTGISFNQSPITSNKTPLSLMRDEDIESTRNFELYRLHSVKFELTQGDTLVFVDFPVQKKGILNRGDCHDIVYKSQQYRVHSSKLLDTGSPKFAEMLGPTYQFRIQRRRKLVNKLPEGVKYVLDLTPASEGDELVFQVTELSLTPGIIKWWSSAFIHSVDSWLVSGHDDICACHREKINEPKVEEPKQESSSEPSSEGSPVSPGIINAAKKAKSMGKHPIKAEEALAMKAKKENETYETPPYRRIPDYCPIRHRNGIIRLLMLIEGKGVILDSAIRVWTLVKLATIFDCASVLRDRVVQWMMHGTNGAFVEVLPEEALQLAFALQVPSIAQCSFRILVNELALKLAAKDKQQMSLTQTTIFGRRVGDLPDELSNLVQHAARALVDRVADINGNMRNPDMFDFWDIPEWNRLRAIEQLLANENTPLCKVALVRLRLLMNALVYEVTDAFDIATAIAPVLDHPTYSAIDEDRLTYVEPKDFERSPMIMKDFTPIQMLLCSTPYNDFGSTLDGRTFSQAKCKLPGFMHKTLQQLVDDTTDALRDIINNSPALTRNAAWAPCLYVHPVAGVTSFVKDPIVSLTAIEHGIKDAIRPITLSWVRKDMDPSPNLTRHLLLTLTNNEMKYLPLWAGGCNDGTGGVFEDPIPLTEMGPNGPGPAFHTGFTIPSTPSSLAGSIIEDMDALRVWGSTTAASVNVHDSISTVYRTDQVIAEDESILSESFTAAESEYQTARFAVPADHQDIAEAVDMTVETTDSEAQSAAATPSTLSDDDDEMGFWNDDSDSDDSVASVIMISR
ncbi:hypothetical protein ACJZ2D_006877 [Fusarium nematophilum]